jgi:hypothetical protein
MPHVLGRNIETITDISGFAAANNLLDESATEVRGAMGDKLPSVIDRKLDQQSVSVTPRIYADPDRSNLKRSLS